MITGGLLALLLQAQAAAAPVSEAGCSMVLRQDGVRTVEPAPSLQVLGRGEGLAAEPPPGALLDALWCDRSSVVPQQGDHRVAEDLGLPLYISAGERTVVLRRSGEGWTLRLISGPPLTIEEAAAADASTARINREHFGF